MRGREEKRGEYIYIHTYNTHTQTHIRIYRQREREEEEEEEEEDDDDDEVRVAGGTETGGSQQAGRNGPVVRHGSGRRGRRIEQRPKRADACACRARRLGQDTASPTPSPPSNVDDMG